MDKVKEHNRLDKMIARTKELQKEIDHRQEVEEKVFRLFSEGKFEEGKALLDTLDDGKVRELMEDNKQPEKTIDLQLRVNCKDNRFPDSLNKIEEAVKRIVNMQKAGYYLNVRIVANL